MVEHKPGWVNGVTAADARLITGAMTQAQNFGDSLDPVRVRPGIRETGGDPGLVKVVGNKITVNPFQAVLADPATPGTGPYVATLDAIRELPLGAADPSRSRVDLVVAEIIDDAFAVTLYAGDYATPTVPPKAKGTAALPLAEIPVPAASTPIPTPTDRRQFTASLNGILPVRGAGDLPPAAKAHASQFIYRLDTGALQVRQDDGGGNFSWGNYRPPYRPWDLLTFADPIKAGNAVWKNYYHGYAAAGYTVTPDGWVRLRGTVAAGSYDQPICKLPGGLWPKDGALMFPVAVAPTSTTVLDVGRVDVGVDGFVTPRSGPSNLWLSLANIAFAIY